MNIKQIKFNKHFGQNFIFDTNLLKAIVSDAEITSVSEVLEIGTGAGTLTKQICNVAKKVVTYEIDNQLSENINASLVDCSNVEVIYQDILKANINEIENNFENSYTIVANLPYYITTPIIFKFLEQSQKLNAMVIMVQKEVAERLCAKENTSQYGAITVMVNAVAHTSITRIVKRNMFIPQPNVDSAVVKIKIEKDRYNIESFKSFSALVKSAFHMRRKTLVNNLKKDFDLNEYKIEEAFNKLNLPLNVRGEVLSPQQFVQLSNLLF